MASRDVEKLWSVWNRLAESVLLALADPPKIRKTAIGRGTQRMFLKSTLMPLRHAEGGGSKSRPLRHITACIASLRPVILWQRQRNITNLGVTPWNVQKRWEAALRHGEAVEVETSEPNMFTPDAIPSLQALLEFSLRMKMHFRRIIAREEGERVR